MQGRNRVMLGNSIYNFSSTETADLYNYILNLLWTFTKLKKSNFTKNINKLTNSRFNIYEYIRAEIDFKT